MVLAFPWGKEMNGAVVTCYPEVPVSQFNHVADIDISEDEAKDLLDVATKYFVSKGSSEIRFRTTPLTSPRSFGAFLRSRGFAHSLEDEESAMVFKGKHPEEMLPPEVKVKEVSESEVDLISKLMLTIFEMPFDWKKGVDRFILEIMRKGARCYVAYVGEKPVGISGLLSFMKTGEIFNVGTLKTHRRLGIGTALTAHAVRKSIKEGNTLHILYTEKKGNAERIYRKVGFRTDHTVVWFVKHLNRLPLQQPYEKQL
jgi:ribosomal protein S18 acetylase RimI-like enzyme